jgi:NitT/TauT family transport system substrate-binding protein
MHVTQNRRDFLTGLSAMGATGLWADQSPASAEPPPETTRVRLPLFRNISDCQSPEFVATELLHGEGFTDVQYVETGTGPDSADWLGHDEIDFDWNFPPAHVRSIANGLPIKVLAGMHGGCVELFANNSIANVKELKGKRVGVDQLQGVPHIFLIIMAAYVGLDPYHDINWTTKPNFDAVEMFAAGEIDAFLGGPPQPQQMRARKLGHVILKMGDDRPWSDYFCCMLSARSAFVERYPVATKRVLRAMLKSVDLCVSDPERIARLAVEGGYAADYDITLQALREVRYDVWREFDPEDSLRFYALRMLDSGIVTANPKDVIGAGTDWRFINELKRELKT